ncbi:hypothetical protein D3C72_2363610 [compost metagenome]
MHKLEEPGHSREPGGLSSISIEFSILSMDLVTSSQGANEAPVNDHLEGRHSKHGDNAFQHPYQLGQPKFPSGILFLSQEL